MIHDREQAAADSAAERRGCGATGGRSKPRDGLLSFHDRLRARFSR